MGVGIWYLVFSITKMEVFTDQTTQSFEYVNSCLPKILMRDHDS